MRALAALFGIGGGGACIVGGFWLLNIQAASQNSLMEGIAHGIGIYCMGKGVAIWGGVILASTSTERLHSLMRGLQSMLLILRENAAKIPAGIDWP